MSRNGRIAAMILAAGYSSRMGEPKPLLPLGGSSLLEEAVGRFLAAGIEDVRVVVGHKADEITPALDRLHVKWVLNPDYATGMLSSVRAGVKSLEDDIEAFFVLPVDIPLVKPRTIEALVLAYRESRAAVVYPRFQGERGHPPLLSTDCVIDLPSDFEGGLRAYLSRYEDELIDLDVTDQAVVMDCDTPDDYRLLQGYRSRENVPTVRECEALWDRFNVSEDVRAHSRLVAELARLLAVHLNRARFALDVPLVVAAGYLHDLMKGEPDHARAGAAVLERLDYPQVAHIVASHMDIRIKRQSPGESELIYLADKYAEGDRIVRLEERFDRSLAKFASNPEILEAVVKRLRDAETIRERVETILNAPIEPIIEKYSRGLQMASAGGPRKIYLVRHGAIRLNEKGKHFIGQLDVPLSEEGMRQARALGETLRHVPISAIYCSDLARSVATAEIIAEPHDLPINARRDLREIALGRWEGLAFDEIRRRHAGDYEERGRGIVHFRPPGGESFLDCTCRVIPALFHMLRSTRGDILVAGHAGVNRILLCHARSRSLDSLLEIRQDYGCLNVIDCRDLTFEARVLNDTSHLQETEPQWERSSIS
jgi:alpha-ribazole phosphatase